MIPDLHLPFNHKNALEFLTEVSNRFKCNTTIILGDIFDQYTMSRYAKDPEANNVKVEFTQAKNEVKKFIKKFPNAVCLFGNHDVRIMKRLREANIPPNMIIPTFNQLYDLPKTWSWTNRVKKNEVVYLHGSKTGPYAHFNTAKEFRCSTVIGHTHSTGAVQYSSSFEDTIFGMNAGCLIDDTTYAFYYANEMANRPVLGCGVVLDDGKLPIFVPMK